MNKRHTCIHCKKRKLEKYMKRVEQYGSKGLYRWKCNHCGFQLTNPIMDLSEYVTFEVSEGVVLIPLIPIKNMFGDLVMIEEDKDGNLINHFILCRGEDYDVLFHPVVL